MTVRHRPRLIASVITGLVIFAGSLAALHVSHSYTPVFRSCASGPDITIAGGNDTSLGQQRQRLIDQWNSKARGSNPKARIVEISDHADLRHSQMMAAEQSGSCGYDVLMLDVTWTAEFASKGLIQPIPSAYFSDQDATGFIPSALRTGRWKGQQYAIPFSSNVGLLFYRAGTAPARTWDDLVSSGYAGQFLDYEGLTVNALEAIWNDGGPGVLTGSSGHITPETVTTKILPALRKLAAAMRNHGNALSASRSYDENSSQDAFANGRPPFMRNWPNSYYSLAADPRQWHGNDLTFGVAPLPGGYSVLGGDNLAISSDSGHSMKQLMAFIDFLTSQESEHQMFTCAGIVPARLYIIESPPECSPEDQAPVPSGELSYAPGPAQKSRFDQALNRALSKAVPRPNTPHYSAFSTTFRACVEKVLSGDQPSADNFAAAVDAALDGRGQYPKCHT